jgi:hypothetical protein
MPTGGAGEAFGDLPSSGQRLIAPLPNEPPVPYAEISARPGIPVSSIGPQPQVLPEQTMPPPSLAALIDAGNSVA